MVLIDSDQLQSALTAVTDAQKAWETALAASRDDSPLVTVEEHQHRLAAVEDAERDFHHATSHLTYRVQALIEATKAQGT